MHAAAPLPAAEVRALRRLAAAALALVGATAGLIVLGALVRAHGAGLACPDWPRCFGRWVPAMDVRVAFEWSHRALAGGVALGFAALGAALLRRPAARGAAGRAWALGAVLLALQIALGALTVWHLLARWTVTAHLVTGNAFNVSLLFLALALRERAQPRPRAPVPRAARGAVGAAAALLALQMVLGGLVSSSYAGLACPDWPSCFGGAWVPGLEGPVGLHLAHRWNGALLALALGAAALFARGVPRLAGACALAAAIGALQVAVGVANVLLRLPVEVTGLHSALAAALVLVAAAAAREAFGTPARAG
jgi:cytochrome c oxidase assembly protein subunit 15